MTDRLRRMLSGAEDIALVRVRTVAGSAPREAGAWMLVTARETGGTIGGGQLEYRAIGAARAVLVEGRGDATLDMALGPEIGQCCGGRVTLAVTRLDARSRADIATRIETAAAQSPAVHVFGAGHVGRALARAMRPLPVRLTVIDTREEELARLPEGVARILTPLPESIVARADPGSAFVVLTHDHALDFLIASAALGRGDARYVGMIGSGTKRAAFARWCRDRDTPVDPAALVCPIGAQGSADKRPEIVAAFVAAEVIAVLTAQRPA